MANSATIKLVITAILISKFIAVATTDDYAPQQITYFPIFPNSSVNDDDDTRLRRSLAPFQLCLPCKCCAAVPLGGACLTMPCCFGIDCQIPNKPFGFCAFVPKTCNCTLCA